MKEQILEIVHSDAKSVNGFTSANIQRCFALKNGINDMLDVSRQTYCELMEQTSSKCYWLKNLKILKIVLIFTFFKIHQSNIKNILISSITKANFLLQIKYF